MQKICKHEGVELPDGVLEWICHTTGNSTRECIINLELVVNSLASGNINPKKLKIEQISKQLGTIVGVPNYELVQQYLANTYAGKVTSAVQCMADSDMPRPIFLKSCIDVHTNVIQRMIAKDPSKTLRDGWALKYTGRMVEFAGLERSEETIALLARMTESIMYWYERTGAFQLGNTNAGLVNIATVFGMKFRVLHADKKN
jgi:hypothetical protein